MADTLNAAEYIAADPSDICQTASDPFETATANGHLPPSIEAVPTFGGEDAAVQDTSDQAAADVTPGESVPVTRGLYFVRVPRPNVDESAIKKLTQNLVDIRDKIKNYQQKRSVKLREVNELRRQTQEARTLKDGSSPEFDEKNSQLRKLRDLRAQYKKELGDIRAHLKGIDCKSEQELDARIHEMEQKIAYEGVPLSEEKKMVQMIAKLNSQRERVREYDSHKDRLAELETESKKVQAVIQELEGDFNVLKSERDQAFSIMQDYRSRKEAAEKGLKEVDEEIALLVKERQDIEQQLDAAREAVSEQLRDFKENRNLGLQVRDLVAAGQVEQARALCAEQVEVMMGKINSDAAYRADYYKLWQQQRKYVVSELLPDSGPAPAKEAMAAANRIAAGKGPAAKPAKPQGAAKAAAIIASAMEQTRQHLQEKVSLASPPDEESDEPEPEPEAAAAPAAAAPRLVAKPRPAAETAAIKAMSELPNLTAYDADFKAPVVKSSSQQLSAAEQKERIREEQRAKAAEAELRKKRRQEALAKKKEKGQAREQERAKAAADAAAKAAAEPAVEEAKAEGRASSSGGEEEEEAAAAPGRRAAQGPVSRVKHGVNVKALVPPAVPVKVKGGKDSVARKALQFWNKNMGLCIFGIVLLLVLLIAFMVK